MKKLYILLYIFFFSTSVFAYTITISTQKDAYSSNTYDSCSAAQVGQVIYANGELINVDNTESYPSTSCPPTNNGNSLVLCRRFPIGYLEGIGDTCRKVVVNGSEIVYRVNVFYHVDNVIKGTYNDPMSIVSQSTNGHVSEYLFSDGSYEVCDDVSQTCSTLDKNGNSIPNLPINGITYNAVPNVVTQKFMSIGGLILAAIGGTAVVVGSGGIGTPAVIASLGTGGIYGGLALSGNEFVGDTPYTIPTAVNDNLSSTPQGIKIDLTHLDLSKKDTSTIDSISSTGNPVTTKYNDDGSVDTVEITPTDIKVTKKNLDESQTQYVVPKNVLIAPTVKNDLSETNNPSDTKVTKIVTPAPTINNDGTKTWHTDLNFDGIYGFGSKVVWSSSTTTPIKPTTKTSSSVGSGSSSTSTKTTLTTDPNGTVLSKSTSTTSSDLSTLTNRLDQIITQNTKNNEIDNKLLTTLQSETNNTASINDKLGLSNKYLKNIKDDINSTSSKLDLTNKKLKNINDNLSDINSTLNIKDANASNGVSKFDTNIIDINTSSLNDSSNYMDNIQQNLAYLTSDIVSIKTQYTDLKTLLEGDTTQLTLGASSGFTDKNIEKFASIIAPYSAVFALLTYVSFMLVIFKMIFAYFSRGE